MYAEGLGIPKDTAKAISLYEKAAKRGEFFAQIALGRIYSRGIGVPVDRGAALGWYSAAATEEGDCEEWREADAYIKSVLEPR
jgi:TPR repeat protein